MTDPLAKLFGSSSRVKLLRLFLFNPRQSFTVGEAAARSYVSAPEVKRETMLLESIGVVERATRGKGLRYTLDPEFRYISALQGLLLDTAARGNDLPRHLRGIGTLKFIALSGIFMGEWEGRLDVLVAGERIKERLLRERMKRLEAELGREIRFALLTSEDLLYRFTVSDKLVRDIFDYPHRIILDRLNTGLK
jgi:hypothetical protein